MKRGLNKKIKNEIISQLDALVDSWETYMTNDYGNKELAENAEEAKIIVDRIDRFLKVDES